MVLLVDLGMVPLDPPVAVLVDSVRLSATRDLPRHRLAASGCCVGFCDDRRQLLGVGVRGRGGRQKAAILPTLVRPKNLLHFPLLWVEEVEVRDPSVVDCVLVALAVVPECGLCTALLAALPRVEGVSVVRILGHREGAARVGYVLGEDVSRRDVQTQHQGRYHSNRLADDVRHDTEQPPVARHDRRVLRTRRHPHVVGLSGLA
mmetsp:Transcript_52505/g.131975  ORF Transcript_52505/g.131975 Transcript_52505/m.131975 type:complete len:204 (+) Transcript_52505:1026-1637(+)